MEWKERDRLGRFVKGHAVLPARSSVNGRFVSCGPMDNEPSLSVYDKTVREVDCFLECL